MLLRDSASYLRRMLIAVGAAAGIAATTAVQQSQPKTLRREFSINGEAGIHLFVREVVQAGNRDRKPILLVHGTGSCFVRLGRFQEALSPPTSPS